MKQLRFVIVGAIVTLFDFAIYSVLAKFCFPEALELDALIATFIAMFLAYFLHSRVTWQAKNVGKREIIRFFIWNGIVAVAIGPGFTWFFGLDFWSWLYDFAYQISSAIRLPFSAEFVRSTGIYGLKTVVVMVLNYLFYDKFVFGKKSVVKNTSKTEKKNAKTVAKNTTSEKKEDFDKDAKV